MKYLIMALLIMPLLASCAVPVSSSWLSSGQGSTVSFHVTEQGISVDTENIRVGNMSPGRIIRALYRIHNDTDEDIKPDIYPEYNVDPERYPKANNYSAAPSGLVDWLIIPDCTPISPGEFIDYPIQLDIPRDASILNDKWAFRVGASGDCGGFTQMAVSVWWLIDMR